MTERAQNLGRDSYSLTIKSNQKIIEALNSFRELTVRGRAGFYANEIRKSRYEISKVEAEMQFLPNVTKYTIESGVLVGTLILGAMQFVLLDASRAAATLAVFMAAGTRLAPAVLRMQHSFLQLRTSMGSADKTLNWIKDLEPSSNLDKNTKILDRNYPEFVPNVDLENVSFIYSGAGSEAVKSVSVSFAAGSVTGIVGGSGAGKTTLTDLILGVLMPENGSIKIGGLSPQSAIKRWPGGISYVPQDVAIVDGTIRENVSLGYPCDGKEDVFVWKALEVAQLSDFVKSLPEGLDSQVGDSGTRLSGGQRQRLGIARALFTLPRLIVLDEATSALDGNLELELSDAIKNLRGEVTVILIAHRLSTLRSADQIIYLSEGELVANGTIEYVKNLVPDFESQANLMGL
jgi:ABC-type multidrug transport system fused ATPase/permease subunit